MTLPLDRSSGTDAKFGRFVKIGQFTTFQFESGVCEIKVKEAKVEFNEHGVNLKL